MPAVRSEEFKPGQPQGRQPVPGAAQGRIEAARNRAKSKSQPSAELGAERELRREREAHVALVEQVERSSRND